MRSLIKSALILSSGALALLLLANPASAQYQVVWEDNFDGNSLDLNKWEPMIGTGCPWVCGWGNNELQYYRSENATVGNGMLTITARQQSFAGQAYTSARLRTKNRGDWLYGRIEMRAKLPEGQGIWPAFWLLPTDDVYGGWAASGEIDVMELVGNEPSRIHGTLHYGDSSPGNTYSGDSYTLPSGKFSDDFHEFALEWDEFEMRWYVDGIHYATQNSWWTTGGPYPAPFDQRFHILVNLAVGGNWPGSPNASTVFPQTYEIDYIRVLQDIGVGIENCVGVIDDMEHANPVNNGWFTFEAAGVSGSIGATAAALAPSANNTAALAASFSNGGTPGYVGGFGRDLVMNAATATHFEMWVDPSFLFEGSIEVNIQDDDDGDQAIVNPPDGADDEFQYTLQVGPPGSGADLISGAGWQHVSIPLADFVDDNSYHFGGNGILDLTAPAAGGNGGLVATLLALSSDNALPVLLTTDDWRFTERSSSIAGRVWNDIGGDGIDLTGEPGIEGVELELVDTSIGAVVAAATTDANGNYSFPEVAGGIFEARVMTSSLPSGATPTFDPDGIAGTPSAATITLVCGNNSPTNSFGYDLGRVGTNFCSPAQLNSSGAAASIYATGSAVVASNDLTLHGEDLPTSAFGFFIVSGGQTSIPGLGGGQGTLCVGPSIGRAVGDTIFNSGQTGEVSVDVDLLSLPTPNTTIQVQPGETWYFQGWFRDVNPAPTSNLTDGLRVTFL